MIYHASIADPDILAAIDKSKREKEEQHLALIGDSNPADGVPDAMSMQEFLDAIAEVATELNQKEDWEFEEVDIPGSLYMFDMFNPSASDSSAHSFGEYGGNESFFDDYDEDDECSSWHNEFDEYDDDELEEFDEEREPEDTRDTLEINFDTVGSIRFLENNFLEIKYDESGVTGEADAFVRFLLDCNKKDFVTVHRSGQSDMHDMWLDCEKGERVNGIAHSRHFSAAYSVNTKEIVNNLTPRGGYFKLSYIRETNGMPLEIVTHIISASPIKTT